MGSEVDVIEERIEEFNDIENTVFVAVGKNVEESKSLILWSLQFFAGMKICLLHIRQPTQLVTLLDDKLYASRLKEQVVKARQELEQQNMHKILNQYSLILSQAGVHASKVWVEADNVETGITQTITQHGIQWLVMGSTAEKLYSKDMLEPNSNKEIYICQHAPISCQIWFVCNGHLINTRKRSTSPSSHLRGIKALTPSPAVGETTLTLRHESQDQLVQSLSNMFLEGPQGLSSSELQDKLVYATTDAENSKQKAFEESIKRWRAEEDAKEALRKAEKSENTCTEEVAKRKATEATLAKKSQEIKTIKSQLGQFIEKLQTVKDEKPGLVDRISKAHDTEKELEQRIIQAVNLLISFKEKRDNLKNELDNTRREINRFSKYKNDENTDLSGIRFYKPSFLEITKATQDFNQSLKIGEGKRGTVYKGILCHIRVAIKMLPSVGSQNDAQFEHEAEVLGRIRHPNLVTLIGVCPETRSLIYEYLENGNLEDQITYRGTSPPLPWQALIRIASEICSALIFLHASKPQIIHGNLTLTNILLDSNHVSKLTDLGINRLISGKDQISSNSSYNDVESEVSAYMDPEIFESGIVSASSDVYSFGVVLLRILTGRSASSVVIDTKRALENGNFGEILDSSGRDWPIEDAERLADLGLRCCEKKPMNRPDLVDDVLTTLETMRNVCIDSPDESENHRRIPSYFVCPIFQEVMEDPYIAADGFTYEAGAIKGWLNSGHKTSPMTNLKLDHCDLLPNHALSIAIQEWQQHPKIPFSSFDF